MFPAEELCKQLVRLIKVFDGDADMFEFLHN
jgi:hypothetical protein